MPRATTAKTRNRTSVPSPRAAHGNQPPDIEDDGIIPSMIMNAWAPSTRKKRIPITSLFQTFCEEEGVCALPASETTLCKFTLHRAGTIAGVTIRGAVAAIHAWHTQLGYVWNGGERLSACQKAAENLTPASSRFPKRPPFTMQHLETLAAKLSKDDPLDVAVFALATSAFHGQLRLGEVLSPTQGAFEDRMISAVSDLAGPITASGSFSLFLPFTKTKGSRGDTAILCRQDGPTDAIAALARHLSVNQLPHDCPLFSYRSKKNSVVCLTTKTVVRRVNDILGPLGHPRLTGHCLRIGGTTELLCCGVDPLVVKATGRWSSDAFLEYWRSLHILAPLHIEFLRTNNPVLDQQASRRAKFLR